MWLNGMLSSKCDVLPSVSQTNILGPLLFDLFIDESSLYVHGYHLFLFADDWKVFESFFKSNLDCSLIQDDYDNISNVCRKVQLQISVHKCQILTVTGGWNDNDFNEIPNAEVVRDLELMIDSKITSNQHCLEIVNDFFLLKSFLKISKRVHKCYVLPLLDYCSQIYLPSTMKKIIVETIQMILEYVVWTMLTELSTAI